MASAMFKDPNIVKVYKETERITGEFASMLLKQAGLDKPSSKEPVVLVDNACGTGIVAQCLHNMLGPNAQDKLDLTCTDFSGAMIDATQSRIKENGWTSVKAVVADAQVCHPLRPSNHR